MRADGRGGGVEWLRRALLAAGAAAMLAPVAWMLLTSVKSYEEIIAGVAGWLPATWRWDNYVEALTAFPFGRYFGNSVLLAAVVVAGTLVSCALGAYAFAWLPGRWSRPLFGLLLAATMLPGQVTAVPLFRHFARLGWLDTYLPLAVPAWLGTNVFALFLLRQVFRRVPRETIDAARIDGASELRILLGVVVPQARAAVVVVALLAFVASWNDLWGPLVYLQDPALYTLPVGLVALLGEAARPEGLPWHLYMAGATVMIAPVIAVFVLAQSRGLLRGCPGWGG